MKASNKLVLLAVAAALLAGCGGAESRKARYIEKGEEYLAAGNYEKASVEFRNALQIDPTDAEARFQVGQVAEKLANPRDAVGHYLAAIEADPKHNRARAAVARLYLFGGLADRALELISPGIIENPKDAELLTVRGAARAQKGNIELAFEDAEAAVAIAPGDEYAIALLASLYRQSARTDRAMEVVRTGLTHSPNSTELRIVLADLELAHQNIAGAVQQLDKVIELQPKELKHRFRLARLYVLNKDIPAAEAALVAAIEAAPDSVDAKLALADLLASHQQYDKAEHQLKAFAARDEDNAALHLAIARFYEAHSKTEQAEQTYRAVIEAEGTKPNGLAARNRLAAMYVQRSDTQVATKLIEDVLEANARDNDALVLRGNLSLARGDAPGAIADLRAVLRDQPNAIPVMRALARAHLQNKEPELAEETLKAASQANPTDRVLRMELAQLFAQTGRAEQARPMLEQLVKETPDDIATLETLFRIQALLKDVTAARATAQTVQKVKPDLPLGWHLEGVLSEAQQQFDDAYRAYTRALELEPNAAEPLTALTRLDVSRKQSERALARIDKVITERPENVIARNLKGELLLADRKADAAAAAFNDTIARAQQWWMPYRGLALSHLAAKRTEDAITAYQRGIKDSRETASLAVDLAALFESLGRTDEAINVYEALLKREPKSVGAANNLAMLLVSYKSDKASIDRAFELTDRLANVDEPAILNTRGWVMFKRGDYQSSLPLLQKAVEKSPQSSLMRYHLGMAQLRTGDRAGARQSLEAALTGGKAFVGSKEAQSALDEIKQSG